MTLIVPDDQVLDYVIFQKRLAMATKDILKFLGFYEQWRLR